MKCRNRVRRHGGRSAYFSLAVLLVGPSLGLGSAGADETGAGTLPETVTGLADRHSPEPEDARLRPLRWMGANLFFAKGGLEYRRELKLGDLPIDLGLQGPLMHKNKQAEAGMTVEIRF